MLMLVNIVSDALKRNRGIEWNAERINQNKVVKELNIHVAYECGMK